TYAQCQFGLDWPEGWNRYRLYPLRGRHALLAKDAAFLLPALVLVAGLDPLGGLAAALAALAIGHHAAVYTPVPQKRWRFTGGTLFPTGLLQAMAMFGAGVGVHREPAIVLGGILAMYVLSVWFYGRVWDRS